MNRQQFWQILWDLMADSYRNPLWAAAYVLNGGCSDDGFDYFRGWLIAQGRTVFERAVADPDTLAVLPDVRAAAPEGVFDCEEMLSIAWNAHQKATGQELPADVFTIRYPGLDPAWDFDFDDREEMARRLPALTALYSYSQQAATSRVPDRARPELPHRNRPQVLSGRPP